MGRCGTIFKDETGLDATEKETLRQLEWLASRLEKQAYDIRCAIEYCNRNQTTKGLSDMVAYSFNAQQHTPQYGGGNNQLPAGPNGENVKYKVMIVGTAPEETKDNFGNVKGGYLAFELASIEGPTQGQKQIDRLNLHNSNPKVVEIANKQLSAYCHVVGRFQFSNTEELHNIPFIVEIGLQRDKQGNPHEKGYTEVKALFDINGNEPGKAGSGPQPQQQNGNPAASNPAPAGVTAQGGWGGGAPNAQQGGQPQQQGQPQGDPNAGQNNGQQGGWGGQQGQQPQQQGQPQGNAGWGGNGGGGQPQGGNAGWGQQGGNAGGGAAGWGGPR